MLLGRLLSSDVIAVSGCALGEAVREAMNDFPLCQDKVSQELLAARSLSSFSSSARNSLVHQNHPTTEAEDL